MCATSHVHVPNGPRCYCFKYSRAPIENAPSLEARLAAKDPIKRVAISWPSKGKIGVDYVPYEAPSSTAAPKKSEAQVEGASNKQEVAAPATTPSKRSLDTFDKDRAVARD